MTDIERHEAHCLLCKSPKRKEIDDLLEDWKPAAQIALDFPEFSEHTIRNHLKQSGLADKRMKNKKRVLHALIERGLSIINTREFKIDAGHVIKAIETAGRLNDDDEIVDKSEITQKHDVSDRVNEQMTNLISKIGGLPSGISPKDIQEPVSE